MSEWIISSSVLIIVIVALRFIIKGKISLKLQYMLWALVLARLLIPFNIGSSSISVMNFVDEVETAAGRSMSQYVGAEWKNRTDMVDNDEFEALANYYIYNQRGQDNTYNESAETIALVEAVTEAVSASDFKTDDEEKEIMPVSEIAEGAHGKSGILNIVVYIKNSMVYVWVAGMVITGAWFLCANIRFGLLLKKSRSYLGRPEGSRLPVYMSDNVDTPCVYGFLKPVIYVTAEAAGNRQILWHVLEHETTHYRHGDHIWCMLRMLVLIIHWYNPLVWLAAVLSREDSELACDEGTIRRIGEDERIEYGRTLIGLTCQRRNTFFVAATTMSGTKKSIKERIVLIAKRPKTALYTFIAVVVMLVAVAGCTFTGAGKEKDKQSEAEKTTVEAENPAAGQGVAVTPVQAEYAAQKLTYSWKMEGDTLIFSGTGRIQRGSYLEEDFKHVVINEGITAIGMGAFALIEELESVVIAESVTVIESWAFMGSEKLTDIDIPEGCVDFGIQIFEGTAWLDLQFQLNKEVYINGIFVAEAPEPEVIVAAPVVVDPEKIVYGEKGSYYDRQSEKLGIVFKELNRDTSKFSLGTEIYYVFNNGGITMKLYKAERAVCGSYEFYTTDFVEYISEVLDTCEWIEVNKPDSLDLAYRIVLDSVASNKMMTFYDGADGIIEYHNGNKTTYWMAKVKENGQSAYDTVRSVYDKLESDVSNIYLGAKTAEYAAEYFVEQKYPEHLYMLSYGNPDRIGKYSLIDWEITSSQNNRRVTGWAEYAFIPHNSADADAEYYLTAGTRQGDGKYEGMYIRHISFVLERQQGGYWFGTELSTAK